MRYNPILHARRSIRLPDYDYSQAGAYYVTVCAHQRRCIFGLVKDDRARPSRIGQIVAEEWLRSCEVRPDVTLDAWVIMPNHIHGIVVVGAHGNAPIPPPSVGAHGNAPIPAAVSRFAEHSAA